MSIKCSVFTITYAIDPSRNKYCSILSTYYIHTNIAYSHYERTKETMNSFYPTLKSEDREDFTNKCKQYFYSFTRRKGKGKQYFYSFTRRKGKGKQYFYSFTRRKG